MERTYNETKRLAMSYKWFSILLLAFVAWSFYGLPYFTVSASTTTSFNIFSGFVDIENYVSESVSKAYNSFLEGHLTLFETQKLMALLSYISDNPASMKDVITAFYYLIIGVIAINIISVFATAFDYGEMMEVSLISNSLFFDMMMRYVVALNEENTVGGFSVWGICTLLLPLVSCFLWYKYRQLRESLSEYSEEEQNDFVRLDKASGDGTFIRPDRSFTGYKSVFSLKKFLSDNWVVLLYTVIVHFMLYFVEYSFFNTYNVYKNYCLVATGLFAVSMALAMIYVDADKCAFPVMFCVINILSNLWHYRSYVSYISLSRVITYLFLYTFIIAISLLEQFVIKKFSYRIYIMAGSAIIFTPFLYNLIIYNRLRILPSNNAEMVYVITLAIAFALYFMFGNYINQFLHIEETARAEYMPTNRAIQFKANSPQEISCPGCGQVISGLSKYCPKCGRMIKRAEERKSQSVEAACRCPNPACGKTIKRNIKFCPYCGIKLWQQ